MGSWLSEGDASRGLFLVARAGVDLAFDKECRETTLTGREELL
jgi:hypothetical protein